MKITHVATTILVLCLTVQSFAQVSPSDEDKAKIQAVIEGYVDAFNEHNAEKLAGTWTEDCNYVDMTGRMVTGRETIQKEYENYFLMHPESSMQISLLSLTMASDDVAVEDGIREVIDGPDSEPRNIRYTAIHVHEGDRWQVKSVRDAIAFEPTNYQYLRGLEWLVGEWTDEERDGVVMQSSCNWSRNRNFLIRNLNSFAGEKPVISATQWIGWDPVEKKIRSWLFDSNGGYGEGTWSQEGKSWVVDSKTTLPSEKVIHEKLILTFVDANQMTFEATDRTLDGEPLPNVKETVVYRAPQSDGEPDQGQGQ
ncbi:MAG: nuclear transport factor 2 family protein [Candidatus Omnitrophica bacterium]|nr:nuclear transport factor 2 family protein [Candidatus Omnitrophota bacterium]